MTDDTTAPSPDTRATAHPRTGRILSLDATRGLLMILMALDHTMAFVCAAHVSESWFKPLPDYGGSFVTFITRQVSHLCAPGFAFLMGAGMILFAHSRMKRGWGMAALIRHFWTRALILLAVSLTIENFFWGWGLLDGQTAVTRGVFFSILSTLGACMAAGALLLKVPTRWLLLLSVLFVTVTPFFVPLGKSMEEISQLLTAPRIILFVSWAIPTPIGKAFLIYPLIPWLGITLAGMAFGRLLLVRGKGILTRVHLVGAGMLVAFAVVRFTGTPGNIRGALPEGIISFFAICKYPPSPAFVLFTLGSVLLLLALFFRSENSLREGNPLIVFGRVPFFFYILHIALYCLIGKLLPTLGYGPGYVVWLTGLALLYLPCRRFAAFKTGTSPDSPWRLF